MPFRQFIARLWVNPLDQMPPSTAGLYPFPVEVWEQIFSLVENSSSFSRDVRDNIHHFFSTEDETHFRDPFAVDSRIFFRTRLSIILVCRSWYHVGVAVLWSHLRIGGKNPDKVTSHVYKTLRHSPMLGTHVTRVTITPWYGYSEPGALSGLIKVLALLPSISIIACPLTFAATLSELPHSAQTRMIVLHNIEATKACFTRTGWFPDRKLNWCHCRSLSFTSMTKLSDHLLKSPEAIIFPNLVNLRVTVASQVVIEWIVWQWNMPALRNISIIGAANYRPIAARSNNPWLNLLTRYGLRLEKVQLPIQLDYSHMKEKVVMPKLKELHLVDPQEPFYPPKTHLYDSLDAPNLFKLTFYVEEDWRKEYSRLPSLSSIIESIKGHFPALDTISIICPQRMDPYNTLKWNWLVVTPKEIADWCIQGLKVEIIWGTKGIARIYGEESFSEYEVGYWESNHFQLQHLLKNKRQLGNPARWVYREWISRLCSTNRSRISECLNK